MILTHLLYCAVAAEYQRKIASIEPISDPEVQRMRLHLVEILCLSTVIDNYMRIVKYVYMHDCRIKLFF